MADHAALSLVTPPSEEPIALADVKPFLRIDGAADDSLVTSLITAARRHFDGEDAWFGRALITQTWDLLLDCFPRRIRWPSSTQPEIVIPLPPLQSVTSISYIDSAGVPQVLPSSDYVVDTKTEPGRVVPAYGTSWPATRDSTPNAVTVRFVAGYGAAAAVPEDIRVWLRQAVAFLYLNREAPELPTAFFWSMARYKAVWGA